MIEFLFPSTIDAAPIILGYFWHWNMVMKEKLMRSLSRRSLMPNKLLIEISVCVWNCLFLFGSRKNSTAHVIHWSLSSSSLSRKIINNSHPNDVTYLTPPIKTKRCHCKVWDFLKCKQKAPVANFICAGTWKEIFVSISLVVKDKNWSSHAVRYCSSISCFLICCYHIMVITIGVIQVFPKVVNKVPRKYRVAN